jgi:hypothetical protein
MAEARRIMRDLAGEGWFNPAAAYRKPVPAANKIIVNNKEE